MTNGLLADLLVTVVAPMATTAALGWLISRLQTAAAVRWSLAAATIAGFLLGYWLLPEWAVFTPDRHWHWVLWVASAAAILGPISVADGIRPWERWLLYIAFAVVASLAIVPNWEPPAPSREKMFPLVTAYVAALAILLDALPTRLQGRSFTLLLALAAFASAGLIAIEVSLKYGQVAAVGAAALAGGALAAFVAPRKRASDEESSVAGDSPAAQRQRALIPLYVTLAAGMAFVGTIEPTEPAFPLLLIPAAPLALWFFAAGPLARMEGATGLAIKTVLVICVTAAAVAWLMLGKEEETDEWSHRQGGQSPFTCVRSSTLPSSDFSSMVRLGFSRESVIKT